MSRRAQRPPAGIGIPDDLPRKNGDRPDCGLLVHDIDEQTGTVIDVELHPDVKFSLGITQYRYPPEDCPDSTCLGT